HRVNHTIPDTANASLVTRRSGEEGSAPRDELVAARARADELDGRADELADPLDVVAACAREVLPAPRGADVGLPARELLVHRLAVLVVRDVRDRVVVCRSAEVVTRADLEVGLIVEDVEPHQRGAADSVEPARVSRHGGVEPADAARTARDGAELVAALADLVPHLVRELGRERTVADA